MWGTGMNAQSMDTGGGYLNSPGYGSSQPSSQSGSRDKRIQNLQPCTIAQIVNAETVNDNIVYNGTVLNQVTLVGLVRSTREGSPCTSYEIDDMSGPILEVRQFLDNESEARDDTLSAIRENIYVRVFGNIRTFNGKRNVVAFKLRPVLDLNELTSHLLEVLYVRAHKNKKEDAVAAPKMGFGAASKVGFGAQPGPSSAFGTGGGMSHAVNSGMNEIQQKVLNVFRMCSDDAGVNVNNISLQLRGVPMKTIREAVDFLAGEGHIFSTIDDDHFRAIDSDY